MPTPHSEVIRIFVHLHNILPSRKDLAVSIVNDRVHESVSEDLSSSPVDQRSLIDQISEFHEPVAGHINNQKRMTNPTIHPQLFVRLQSSLTNHPDI